MLVGVTVMLARATESPEFEVSAEEAKAWLGSAQNVMRHYSVQTTQKTLDWIALMGATGGIVAPRIVAAKIRKSRVTVAAPQPQKPNGPEWQPAPFPHIVPDTEYSEETVN